MDPTQSASSLLWESHCWICVTIGHKRTLLVLTSFVTQGRFQAWRSSRLRMYLEKSDKSLPPKSSTILQIDQRLKLTLVKLSFTSNDSGSFPSSKTKHQPVWSSGSWLTWKEKMSSLSHYWWTKSPGWQPRSEGWTAFSSS